MPRFPPETSATRSTEPLSRSMRGELASTTRARLLRSSGRRIHRPSSRDRVELIGVIQDGRFCRLRGTRLVVGADGVQNLGEKCVVESLGTLLDQAQAEVDVTEELAFGGREEERAAVELPHPPN